MKRKSLAALIDSHDNLQLSADGRHLLIVEWVDGSPRTVAMADLDAVFDRDGNHFHRDAG